jgi:hypothetical protein
VARRGIYVEILIRADLDTVWQRTQDPAAHARWDVRFSAIRPTSAPGVEPVTFDYERRVAWHTVRGTGTSIGERTRPDGTRTSALRFQTSDPLSPLRSGRGYWRYIPEPGGIRFITGYDYDPGWGRVADALFRPLLGWATAWSFDRLRRWIEDGVAPERRPLRSALWFWQADRPRASRCRRIPRRAHAMDDAPSTLAGLAEPEPAA